MQIRNIRRLFWTMTALLCFFFLCDGFIGQKLFGYLGVVLLLIWFVCGFAIGLYPCPTCGEPFFSKRFVFRRFLAMPAESCRNCGHGLQSAK